MCSVDENFCKEEVFGLILNILLCVQSTHTHNLFVSQYLFSQKKKKILGRRVKEDETYTCIHTTFSIIYGKEWSIYRKKMIKYVFLKRDVVVTSLFFIHIMVNDAVNWIHILLIYFYIFLKSKSSKKWCVVKKTSGENGDGTGNKFYLLLLIYDKESDAVVCSEARTSTLDDVLLFFIDFFYLFTWTT
jgi:hypothetical protein